MMLSPAAFAADAYAMLLMRCQLRHAPRAYTLIFIATMMISLSAMPADFCCRFCLTPVDY